MEPSGIEPIVTVPNSLGMVAVFLLIICVGLVSMLVIEKEWKQLVRLLVLGCIVGVGLLCLYVTKVVTDALFLLHYAGTAIPFVWLGSIVGWNAKVKNKELR
ncbi:hypothetical protein [Bacillus thuringiensis]|uniref:hypothetical protein n=1 Tax=Bacillus thuringiensis TaxID=1428 RepID=UPI000BECDE1B|nr:hypothetical protein [Bacillus thuringiensis]EKS8371512.1 hypothetical protein [Bacillus cereus]MBG9494952.1 hypothetical protein [Bacillus thuringiensis]MBG9508287.1 hypothetical protein [Bacillus thuringiensis]MED3391370.1 hypothetical protein [Bacillus thuringiensis]PDY37088.1 hypothetical protein COM85_11110 [Bacillus thuringiensis]